MARGRKPKVSSELLFEPPAPAVEPTPIVGAGPVLPLVEAAQSQLVTLEQTLESIQKRLADMEKLLAVLSHKGPRIKISST